MLEEGLVKQIGISNETPWGVNEYLKNADGDISSRIVTIQNVYNLLSRQFEVGLAEMSIREEGGLLAYSPLASGYLTGKYRNGNLPKGSRIENARSSADQISSTSNKEQETSDFKNDPRAIKSPMVGTVYLQPEPGASQFVSIGDQIKSGQTLLIIEAMKTMNPIESTLQGKVIKVLVENEQAVEFGQPLILIG